MHRLDQIAQPAGRPDHAPVEKRLRSTPLHVLRIDQGPRSEDSFQPVRALHPIRIRRQHVQRGRRHRTLPRRAQVHVTPQAPGPLHQRPDRGQIGNHQVEIQVERGLDHLRRHQHPSRPADAIAAETVLHGGFMLQPVGHREPRVQQDDLESRFAQCHGRCNGAADGIAYPHAGHPLFDAGVQQSCGRVFILQPLHGEVAAGGRNGIRVHAVDAASDDGQHRVGMALDIGWPADAATLLKGLGIAGAHSQRQGCRHDDRGPAQHCVELQQALQLRLHIRIEFVRFIDNENVAGQRPEA